jgi:hypothetical protein
VLISLWLVSSLMLLVAAAAVAAAVMLVLQQRSPPKTRVFIDFTEKEPEFIVPQDGHEKQDDLATVFWTNF